MTLPLYRIVGTRSDDFRAGVETLGFVLGNEMKAVQQYRQKHREGKFNGRIPHDSHISARQIKTVQDFREEGTRFSLYEVNLENELHRDPFLGFGLGREDTVRAAYSKNLAENPWEHYANRETLTITECIPFEDLTEETQ